MLLIITLVALLIIWGLGAFSMWGFEEYRTILAIFLVIVAVLQIFFRARVRSR